MQGLPHNPVCPSRKGGAGEYQLVFFAVPDPRARKQISARVHAVGVECDVFDISAKADKLPMFVRVAEFVKSPEKVISSFVWLERGHRSRDLRADLLAESPHILIKIRERRAEGEAHSLKIDRGVLSPRAGADGLVESVPQIVEGVGGDGEEVSGDGLPHLRLSDIVAGIRVELYNCGMGVVVEEGLTSQAKFVAMFASPIEQELGALKRGPFSWLIITTTNAR
jgi:hypothetical protein